MIFHETLFFFEKLGKISQNLLSAAIVIGTLSVNPFLAIHKKLLSAFSSAYVL